MPNRFIISIISTIIIAIQPVLALFIIVIIIITSYRTPIYFFMFISFISDVWLISVAARVTRRYINRSAADVTTVTIILCTSCAQRAETSARRPTGSASDPQHFVLIFLFFSTGSSTAIKRVYLLKKKKN